MKRLHGFLTCFCLFTFSVSAQPLLTFSPDTLDFGAVWVPRELDGMTQQTVILRSVGSEAVVIQAVQPPDPGTYVSLIDPPGGELSILPGDSIQLSLRYSPETLHTLNTELLLECNTNPTEQRLPIRGSGVRFSEEVGSVFWDYSYDVAEFGRVVLTKPIPDVDGDGIPDVFVARSSGHHLCISGASSDQAVVLWEAATIWEGQVGVPRDRRAIATVSDANQDGIPDVAVGCGGDGYGLYVLSGWDGSPILAWNDQPLLQGDVNHVANIEDPASNGDLLIGSGQEIFFVQIQDPWIDSHHMGGEIAGITPDVSYTWFELHPGTITLPLHAVAVAAEQSYVQLFGDFNGSFLGSDPRYTEGSIIEMISADQSSPRFVTLTATGQVDAWSIHPQNPAVIEATPITWQTGQPGVRLALINHSQVGALNDIHVWSHPNTLSCYSPESGELEWSRSIDSGVAALTTSSDLYGDRIDEVLAGCMDNCLLVLDGSDGSTRFELPLAAPVNALSAFIDLDGTRSPELIVADSAGLLQCVGTGTAFDSLGGFWVDPAYIRLSFNAFHPDQLQMRDEITVRSFQQEEYRVETVSWVLQGSQIDPQDYDSPLPITLGYGESVSWRYTFSRNLSDLFIPGEPFTGAVTIRCDGNPPYLFTLAVSGVVTDLDDATVSQPRSFTLSDPWPNPFNASMTVRYEVPKPGYVSLVVYNLLGRKVAVLQEGHRMPGVYLATWQRGGLSVAGSGTYFLRMQAEGFDEVRRVVLVK